MSGPDEPRVIGLFRATTVITGTMLGVGILLTPPLVAAATGSLPAYLGLWVLGGLVALAGADAYAELGAMMPHAGGDVVFQHRAFGPAVAFASGSLMFALSFGGSVAALATAIGTWQARTLLTAVDPALDPALPLWGPLTGTHLVALSIVLLLSAANALGARVATGVQATIALIPLLAQAALALGVLATPHAPPPPQTGPLPDVSLAEAWAGVYFAYAGWSSVVYVAGEVRDPSRTLPRAMLGGTVLVTGLYALLCLAFVSVLGLPGLAVAGEAGTAMVQALFGPGAGVLMAALVMLSLLACINGTILGGARVAVALARVGSLPAALGWTRPGNGAPVPALLVQAAIASILVLTGSFQVIVTLTSLAMMVIGCLTVAALLALRRRGLPRPYAAVGGPLSPLLYLLVSGGMIVLTLATASSRLPLAGVGLLLLLALGHRLLVRRAA